MSKLFLATLFFIASFAAIAKDVSLQILCTTDTHGMFLPYDYLANSKDYSGSLAQIATKVDQLRKENQDTILVDNGDIIQGNLEDIFITNKMYPMAVAMNAMKYDIVNIGNHEFNYGVPALLDFTKQFSNSDVLCSNVLDKNGELLFKPYKIVTTKSGVKVAFIGGVTPVISKWDTKYLKDYKVLSPIHQIKKYAKELSGKVDLIVAVAHMGLTEEYGMKDSTVQELATGVPELDLIIFGHDHSNISDTYYYDNKMVEQGKITKEIKEKGVPIIAAGSGGKELGQILIKFNEKSGHFIKDLNSLKSKLFPMETNDLTGDEQTHISENKSIAKQLQPYHEKALDYINKKIGKLKGNTALFPVESKNGVEGRLLSSPPLLQYVNHIIKYYSDITLDGNKVSVVVTPLLNINDNLLPGDEIKRSDVALFYKYPNTIDIVELNGKQLKQIMEYFAQIYNQVRNEQNVTINTALQYYNSCTFSGLDYDIDVKQPPLSDRITNLKWRSTGKPVKDSDKFLLATSNFIVNLFLSKHGTVFKDGEQLPKLYRENISIDGCTTIKDYIEKYIVSVDKGKVNLDNYKPNWKVVTRP